MTIGQTIREAREARGVTVTRLAELVGVAASTVSRVENDLQVPRQRLLALICAHLEMGRRQARSLEAMAMRLAPTGAKRD